MGIENRPEVLDMAKEALGEERYCRVMAILETQSETRGKPWWDGKKKRTLDLLISIPSSPVALGVVAICGAAVIASERVEGKKFHSPLVDVGYDLESLVGIKRKIHLLKTRTMIPNAQELEIAFCEGQSLVEVRPDRVDPRITSAGSVIRKIGVIDELPQIFNIMKGEMSVVGPRQLALNDMTIVSARRDNEPYNSYVQLLADGIKTGATGFWAVLERHDPNPNFERRIWEEVVYGQEASFKGDLRIIALTFPILFKANSENRTR